MKRLEMFLVKTFLVFGGLFLLVEFGVCEESEIPLEIHHFLPDVGRTKMDLIYIIDRSTSTGKERFYIRELKLLQAMTYQYVTLHPDYVRIAAITFGNDSTVIFDYISNTPISKSELFEGPNPPWSKLVYIDDKSRASGTNIREALVQADYIFDQGKRKRPMVDGQIIVLVTDGEYTREEDPYNARNILVEQKHVKIYGVGLGSWLKPGSIRILTSQPSYYANFDYWMLLSKNESSLTSYDSSFEYIWKLVSNIICNNTCKANSGCYADVDRGVQECKCDKGFFRKDKKCFPCPKNTYKETFGNDDVCTACPPNAVTMSIASTNASQCSCPTGLNCTDPCASKKCVPGQVCQHKAGVAFCHCREGFLGATCMANQNNCNDNKCRNHAICYDGVEDYACICAWGFRGRFCEINEDECEYPNLCQNGATCLDRISYFVCRCPPGFYGVFCQDSAEEPTSTSTTPSIPTTTTTVTSTVTMTTSSTRKRTISHFPRTVSKKTRSTIMPTENLSASSDGDDDGDSTILYIIIGACVGGVLLIVIVVMVFVAVVLTRRKKRKQRKKGDIPDSPPVAATHRSLSRSQNSVIGSISHKFSGFWRKKTVRGNGYSGNDITRGLPSVPSKRRPDLLNVTAQVEAENEVVYAVLDEQHISTDDMNGWNRYLAELLSAGVMENACIAKLDSDKQARTPSWRYDPHEIQRLDILLDQRTINVPAALQGQEFHIHSNTGAMALGVTIGNSESPRNLVISKTKTFLIVAIADGSTDDNKCLKEIEWIADHMKNEGY